MRKVEELKALQKNVSVDLAECVTIAEKTVDGETTRIVAQGGRYFVLKNGQCFEVAESWRPFADTRIFAYTPDDLHVYEIDSRAPSIVDVKKLDERLIQPGMQCAFHGSVLEFVDDSTLRMDGVNIHVVPCNEYVYKLMSRKIRAIGGARGLYCFLDKIAEEGKNKKYPLFDGAWDKIRDEYANLISS